MYEEITISEEEWDADGKSEEEIEYIYEIEYSEEEEEEKQHEDNEFGHSSTTNTVDATNDTAETKPREDTKILHDSEGLLPQPILLREAPSFRKNISFSSVHSVLTENDDIIFVDENDDIFSWLLEF